MPRLWRLCVFTIACQSALLLQAQDVPLVRNLKLTVGGDVAVTERWVAVLVNESEQGADLNDDGDMRDDNVLHVHDLAKAETVNLKLASRSFLLASDHWLAFTVSEKDQGVDLNGDNDTWDDVIHIHNLESGETDNLRLGGYAAALSDPWLALAVSEHEQGEDLNGDGDTHDWGVVHLHDLRSGETSNLRLASSLVTTGNEPPSIGLSRDWLTFMVYEWMQSEDLNGDGIVSRGGTVHLHNLASRETTNLGSASYGRVDLVGNRVAFDVLDSDKPPVFHLHDLERGETTSLGIRPCARDDNGELISLFALTEDWLAVSVREWDTDLNADGDEDDCIVHVRNLRSQETTNLQVVASSCDRYLTVFDQWLVFEGHVDPVFRADGALEIRRGPLHVHNLESGITTDLQMTGGAPMFAGNRMLFSVYEGTQREDLNGDGDLQDSALYVHNLSSGQTSNLGLAGSLLGLSGDWLILAVYERSHGSDLNGDGDLDDSVLHAADLATFERSPLRGDCNGDGAADIADVVCLLNVLFPGFNLLERRSPELPCSTDDGNAALLDTSGNGTIDIADIVALANRLFVEPPHAEDMPCQVEANLGCPTSPVCQ